MSFFAQQGKKLASGFGQLTNGAPGPTTLFTCGADEWVDVYNIIISTNDTTLQQVTIDDGTNTIMVYFVGTANVPNVIDLSSIPVRTKKGATLRATAAAVTAAKTIGVKVVGLISKT